MRSPYVGDLSRNPMMAIEYR